MMTRIEIPFDRKKVIKQQVLTALHTGNVHELPVKIKAIVRSFKNVRLVSYSKHMKNIGINYTDMLKFAGSEDAFTDYYANHALYIIYYNDVLKWKFVDSNRYRWSIAHELGHILLNHHTECDKTRIFRSCLSDSTYNYLEAEADYFAQLILVPHAALFEFNINCSAKIGTICKISYPASKKRYSEYLRWKSHIDRKDLYDNQIFQFYYNFIYKCRCNNCLAGIVLEKGKYCPICGCKNTLQWGDGEMHYPYLDIYESGKVKVCPICKNEDTSVKGEYCQICGTDLINKCPNENCENSSFLPTNARFCPICGSKSTFYKDGILVNWNNTTDLDFFNIPDGPDEELPFN